MRRLVLLLALVATPSLARAQDGVALLRDLGAAHRGWWTTLTFVQRTTWPGTDRPEETWYETMARPGKLRIDVERNDSLVGGILFRNDSIWQWTAGQAERPPRPFVHPLLVLLHDIHVGPLDAQVAKLTALGFDLSRRHGTTWNGRAAEVVGALAGDTTSSQFWVDPERMVVVRIIQAGPGGARSDVQIPRFSDEGTGLVEREINFFTNGRQTLKEEYIWVRTGVTIPASVWDPANKALPAWVGEWKRQQ